MNRHKLILICLSFTLMLSLFPLQKTSANSVPTIVFEVNSTEDLPDAIPNGICSADSNTNGPCTLRAAVTEASNAIAAGRGNVHIKIPAGHYLLTRTSDVSGSDERFGDLDFLPLDEPTELEVLIEGIGNEPSIIDANGIDRVFEIQAHHNITMSNLTIQNGEILEESSLTIGGAGFYVYYGKLTLKHTRILNNKVVCEPSHCFADGGGIFSFNSTIQLYDTEIAYNHAWDGSGIYFTHAFLNTPPLIIDQCSFHHNTGENSVLEMGAHSTEVFILNSTFSDNSRNETPITLRSETWIQNTTIIADSSSVLFFSAPVHLRNSIIMAHPSTALPNCSYTNENYVISEGGNLFSDSSCFPKPELFDMIVSYEDANLGELSDNGGFSPTVALLEGSRAISRRPFKCLYIPWGQENPSLKVLLLDQRNVIRAETCDAGAFSYNTLPNRLHLPLVIRE